MDDNLRFDMLLRGGRVICPASGIDDVMDVAIQGGRIAAVQPSILPSAAKELIDVTGRLVLPGLIDTHGHVYQYVTGRFGMEPDMVGVQSGVTTVGFLATLDDRAWASLYRISEPTFVLVAGRDPRPARNLGT